MVSSIATKFKKSNLIFLVHSVAWPHNTCATTHGNIVNTIKTSFFRKIYLSLYWKGCVWEGVGDRTKTATYWPPNSSGYHSLSFPFSWAAQPGAWGPSLCWDMVLIPASSLQLTWTSCRRGYIIIWHPPTSRERHNSHSIQPLDSQGSPWYPDIFDRMHLLFTLVHFFFWQLGRVGGQYATTVKQFQI